MVSLLCAGFAFRFLAKRSRSQFVDAQRHARERVLRRHDARHHLQEMIEVLSMRQGVGLVNLN